MADTTYIVKVKYEVDKSGADAAASSLATTFDRLAKTIAGAFAVHRVLEFSKRLIELQSQAETMQTAMATMLTGFSAPGFTNGAKDFEKAMGASSILMTQIRKDAAALPGTAEDLMEAVRGAMPAGIATGHSIMGQASVLEMGKRLMVAASAGVLNIPGGVNTVSREFQAIMEGRTQGRNDLFARLRGLMPGSDGNPISAKEMNKLSEKERWDLMDKTLKKLIDASLPTIAKQWSSIIDTTINWVQQIARVATGGMFNTLKKHFDDLNHWFEKNQASIEEFAKTLGETFGDKLGSALDSLRDAFTFIVNNKGSLITVAQAFGAALIGTKLGGAGIGGGLGGIGAGLAINAMTGGTFDFQGGMMGLAGALVSFGGALGIASAAALAFGATMNLIDPEHKNRVAGMTEASSIFSAVPENAFNDEDAFMNAPGGVALPGMGRRGKSGAINYGALKAIINEQKLLTRPGGGLNETALESYLGPIIRNPLYKQHVKDAFDVASASMSADWRSNTQFGPTGITPEQKLQQLLYEKGKGTPDKPKVDVHLTINQDISQAEDPDRILVRTKQAIEQALIHPIESGDNRFSVLR